LSSLQIFILCYNRPEFARQSIASALAQNQKDFELIVSDNSTSDAVRAMVATEFPQVNYRFRDPHLKALDHFNLCLAEATAEHVCLFHDDDLLLPDFVDSVQDAINHHPQAAAIGVNGWIAESGHTPKLSFRSGGAFHRVDDAAALAAHYFSRHQLGIAPFPGYVYAKARIAGLRFDQANGKYSDVSWLLRVADRGGLVWVVEPLMTYRLHASNDSRSESIGDRLKLLAYFKRNAADVGHRVIDDFRFFICKKALDLDREGLRPLPPRRRERLRQTLSRLRRARVMRLDHHAALLRKTAVKLFQRADRVPPHVPEVSP
jgi:glycosyltransferase involved in cell wall biosynthesis